MEMMGAPEAEEPKLAGNEWVHNTRVEGLSSKVDGFFKYRTFQPVRRVLVDTAVPKIDKAQLAISSSMLSLSPVQLVHKYQHGPEWSLANEQRLTSATKQWPRAPLDPSIRRPRTRLCHRTRSTSHQIRRTLGACVRDN